MRNGGSVNKAGTVGTNPVDVAKGLYQDIISSSPNTNAKPASPDAFVSGNAGLGRVSSHGGFSGVNRFAASAPIAPTSSIAGDTAKANRAADVITVAWSQNPDAAALVLQRLLGSAA